ncbi:MAG: hypothetical protein IT361_19075 [Gemmatimonadaceae bacterium]|nr:hypothetical protein [Gemmatimonadaceae bacterium]
MGILWGSIATLTRCHSPVRVAIRQVSPATLGAARLVVFGSRTSEGASTERDIRQLRRAHPHVGIIVCGERRAGTHLRLQHLFIAGADDVFLTDLAGAMDAFAAAVQVRVAAPVPEVEIRAVHDCLEANRLRPVVLACLRNGHRVWRVGDVATRFRFNRSHLARLLRQEGLPSIGCLLRLGRLLHVRELTTNSGEGATAATEALEGLTPTALRALRMRHRVRNTTREFMSALGLGDIDL